MELNINKIKEIIQDNYLKTCFIRNLELILVVDMNYYHIQQLETLQNIFEGGLSPYYKEYHKEQEFLTLQCGIICNNTFWNHYKKDSEGKAPDVYSLYEELIQENIVVKDFKSMYYSTL